MTLKELKAGNVAARHAGLTQAGKNQGPGPTGTVTSSPLNQQGGYANSNNRNYANAVVAHDERVPIAVAVAYPQND